MIDRRTRQTEQQVFVLCDERVCVSLQDGLVQAAALREGLQRFLHQDRHQKGHQVSGGRVKRKRKNLRHDCRTNMWVSRQEGWRLNPPESVAATEVLWNAVPEDLIVCQEIALSFAFCVIKNIQSREKLRTCHEYMIDHKMRFELKL